MPKTTQYAPVLAKIGAERSKLLSEPKIKSLSDNKNLAELSAQLRDTSYQEQLARITPPLNGRKLERAYSENLIETFLKIIDYSPKHAVQFLQLYLLRFEVEQVKAMIKTTSAKLSIEQKLAKIYFSVEDYLDHHSVIEEAAKASTIAQVIHAFKGTGYFSPLTLAMKNYEETASTASFDILVDKYYYEELCERYHKLPKKERKHAEFYTGIETDSFTLLTLLRGKLLNTDPNWLRLVIPQFQVNLSKKKVEDLVSAIDFDATLKIVLETDYGKYFSQGQEPYEMLSSAAKAFRNAIFQHAKASIITNTFNIGLPLAFMTQKEAEVRNLVAITLGVESTMKPETIRDLLLF